MFARRHILLINHYFLYSYSASCDTRVQRKIKYIEKGKKHQVATVRGEIMSHRLGSKQFLLGGNLKLFANL
jgi:hypothetical protein